ncbi:MAG: hypothetical protein RL528_798 [Bacteroidota bacterium]|jgi:hypothetical protein
MVKFKILLLLFLLLKITSFFSQESMLSIDGTYLGKNLLVSNPPQADGFGFCVNKVIVNGEVLPATIQKANFEIDFSLFNLKSGEQLFIVLSHNEGCVPKFINPEVLLPKSTFICEKISATNKGLISWSTKNEKEAMDFALEQFKWNKWVKVGEVRGNGGQDLNNYSFQIIAHSGKNRVRVSQIDNTGIKRVSPETSFNSLSVKVKKSPSKVSAYIYFKANQVAVKSKFELYDAFGNLLKVGFSDLVDCRNLVNGVYFINFDNTTEKFIKAGK